MSPDEIMEALADEIAAIKQQYVEGRLSADEMALAISDARRDYVANAEAALCREAGR